MCRLVYLLTFIAFVCTFGVVYGSENATFSEVPVDTLVNLTGNNELWTLLLKDCQKPTLTCVQNNIFKYLKETLDATDDIQFTSFLKFTKNTLDYEKIERSFEDDTNDTEEVYDEESPIEYMSRSLQENTAKFFMTHDLEVSLPDGLFDNSVLKIAPKGFENNGALVNLEVVSKDLEPETGIEDASRTFKKIRKFINEKIIYAILAILIIVKLLAVKFLFLLPLLVGAATAKKLLLKILLFVFPFLHHIFKFCAYYPIQAKFHHHKHLISHIHEIAPHKHHDHHEGVEVIAPHGYGPPIEHHGHHDQHFTELDDDVSVFPDDGSGFPHGLISHRKDPTHGDNEISSHGHVYSNRRRPNRPLTSTEIQRVLAKAEKEAIIKARLEKERIRIREENLQLQEQLNQAIKLQEKLKQQAIYLHKKLPPTKIVSSVPYNHKPATVASPPRIKGPPFEISSPTLSDGPGIDLPPGYIPQHTVPQRPQTSHLQEQNRYDHKFQSADQNHFDQQYQETVQHKYSQPFHPGQVNLQSQVSPISPNTGFVYKLPQQNAHSGANRQQLTSSDEFDTQQSVNYDPRVGVFDNSKKIQSNGNTFMTQNGQKPIETFEKPTAINKPTSVPKPKLEQEIYKAASITYDSFYSPILQKIDKILEGLGFNDEPCRERLVCNMYKNPSQFSPHSNLLSAELSRDSSELQKPSSTNSAVIRFYKYVQAARDGQDQRDCLRLYPTCSINIDVH